MATAQLSVEFKAEIQKLRKGVKGASDALEQFEAKAAATQKELSRLTTKSAQVENAQEKLERLYKEGKISLDRYKISSLSFAKAQDRITGSTKNLSGRLSGYNKSIRSLGGRTKGLSKSTGQSTRTLQEFNRVVQDAPFGIRGVANNITELVSAFGDLTKKQGGTGKALKSLLRDMIGPAGIVFAVSAVTSLLVTYGDELFKAAGSTNELAKATRDALANFRVEQTRIQALLSIIRDETQERTKRNEAVAILQKKYPKYLSNLSTENASTKAIKESVDALTKSLELKAKVQGAEELLAEKAKKLLEDQQKAQENYQKAIDNLPRSLNAARQANTKYARGIGASADKVFDAEKNRVERTKDLQKELDDSLDKSEKEYAKYVANITKLLGSAPSLFDIFSGGSGGDAGSQTQKALQQVFSPRIPDGAFGIQGNPLGDVAGPVLAAATADADKELTQFEKRLKNFEAASGQIIQGGILDGFRAFGDGIAEALQGGEQAFANFGKAIFGAIGNFLTQLGEAAILTGIGMLAINEAFTKPFAAIAAGAVLVAAGAAFSKATQSAPGGGAGAFAGAGGGSFQGANTTVTTDASANNQFELVVRGKNLVAVANRNLREGRRTTSNVIG